MAYGAPVRRGDVPLLGRPDVDHDRAGHDVRAENSTPYDESLRICRSVAASTIASRPSGSPAAYVGEAVRATSVSPARKPAFQVAVASRLAEPLTEPTRPLKENVSPGRSNAPESRPTASLNDGPTEAGTGTRERRDRQR